MPVAEPATLTSPDAPDALDTLDTVERFDVAGTRVYVDRALTGAHGSWSIDTDGFARWRRLVVLGVELGPG